VAAGFHPVTADGHRAPSAGVVLGAVDEEQAAFVVDARAQPSGALLGQGVPGQDGTDREPAFRRDAEGPGDLAVRYARDARRAPQERGQDGRRLLTAYHRLKRGPDPQHLPQFLVGAGASDAGQPGAGPGGVGEVVGRNSVDHGRAVEDGQQEVLVRCWFCHRSP
jgi:hypothetical protein